MRFELVIFSCEGVLVDSASISNRVLAEMLTELDVSMTPGEASREYHGKRLRDVAADVEMKLGAPLPATWQADFERRQAEAFACGLKPMPGAAEVIRSVRTAGIDVCVASSRGKLATTRLALGLTRLRGLFDDDALFSADSLPHGKPHTDLFLHAAERRAAQPRGTVVVEDTPAGIEAALAAKMRAFGYATSIDGRDLLQAGAREIILSLEELPELIGL